MGLYAGHFDFTRPLLWTVPNLFTPDECAAVIDSVRDASWLAATVNRADGRTVDARVRDNTTAIVRDPALASRLWERVRPHVPETMSREDPEVGMRRTVRPCGVYEPLRVYRYEPGQHFGLHHDQSYERADGAASLLTLIVYLNDDYAGGETDFPEQNERVRPATGTALLFQHMLLHAGRHVLNGMKYVLRTDVLFHV